MIVPKLESIGDKWIVRDDLLPGGTKMRAIMPLIEESEADEFVYASPAQGFAQIALAHCCRLLKKKATIFTAHRNQPHAYTLRAKAAGAMIIQVDNGYLTVVAARARGYADHMGADLIPFGIEDDRAIDAIAEAARSCGASPTEVWCAAGSGVLSRALQRAWPRANHFAILVGKLDSDCGKARKIIHPRRFDEPAKILPPFPSALNYDAKVWEFFSAQAKPGALFWNVAA